MTFSNPHSLKTSGLMCKEKLQILHLSFSQLIGFFISYLVLIFGSITRFLDLIFMLNDFSSKIYFNIEHY